MAEFLNGTDISGHQAGLRISALTAADFVIIKATGGKGYTNSCWKGWAADTLANGKLLGLYHYGREASCPGSPEEEAAYFYAAVRPYVGRALLFLDWEQELSQGPGWVKRWCDELYRLSGVKPLLYASQSVTTAYDWGAVAAAGYGLWLAQWATNETLSGFRSRRAWQSGSTGAFGGYALQQYGVGIIPGYGSAVDLDQFYGTAADWQALAAVTTAGAGTGSEAGQAETEENTASEEASEEEAFEMAKLWKNGSTKEPVYADTGRVTQVGTLFAGSTCDCIGRAGSMYIVRYETVSGSTKVGLVAYSGGVT